MTIRREDESDSDFLRHIPCTNCGSSDANSEYTDGHTYCFACGHHSGDGSGSDSSVSHQRNRKQAAGLIEGTVAPLLARGITEETCRHFNYMKGTYKSRNVQIAPYYDVNGQMVAQKLRFPDKTFVWLGDQNEALPFGANKFKSGRKIVVTEGEIDALAMSQVQGNQWPVVSIGCGAGPQIRKYIAKHRDYFNSFDEVVLMFDNDEPGREAAQTAAEVIGSAKARIAELPLKDAGEMLQAGQTKELISAMWNAQVYRPSGIVELTTLRAAVMEGVKWGVPWPWQRLTELTYGRRTGEVYCFGAGTGTGKTDVFTQIIDQTVNELNEPCAVFSLEQAPRETAIRIAGKRAQKRFHVPDSGWTMEEFTDTWDSLERSGKVFLYDSFGVNDWEVIEDRIRYLAHGEGVKHFFIDHLTALAAWQDDERKALEVIMSNIGGLVKELDICIYLISHLATPDGTPHEEGGRVMIRHLKGSRAIGYWCHYIFGLERDQQAEDPVVRRTTTFRVLKDRYTGQATGQTFLLRYDQTNGMLDEVTFESEVPAFVDETATVGSPEF